MLRGKSKVCPINKVSLGCNDLIAKKPRPFIIVAYKRVSHKFIDSRFPQQENSLRCCDIHRSHLIGSAWQLSPAFTWLFFPSIWQWSVVINGSIKVTLSILNTVDASLLVCLVRSNYSEGRDFSSLLTINMWLSSLQMALFIQVSMPIQYWNPRLMAGLKID